jgi:hypothetical protein
MRGFNVKVTKSIPIFIFRDAESAFMFSFSIAVQFQYYSSVTVLQFSYSIAVQLQYYSSVTVLQFSYSIAVQL